jgi:hypothetical protein
MSNAYQLIFSSRNPNCISNGTLTSCQYNVNWKAMLGDKFKKFKCGFVFKSENYAGVLTNNGFVNMNIGRMNVFDGASVCYNIGVIYPVVTNNAAGNLASYYNSTNNDNFDFTIDYPVNNLVTLNLNTFAGAAMANMPNYVLVLHLIGIPNDEI